MISCEGVKRTFGDTAAVRGVTFSVNPGEIFGIVGPDGAGKSTLLRLISTILKPDEGLVRFDGKDIYSNIFDVRERLAYMPQRFGLYEDLTVQENIFFFGRLFGLSKKKVKERLGPLYEFSSLAPFRDRLAGALSGGMKQKLGLACCLVHGPELLLLDEPTNGVDPVSRREFWKILYDLLGRGVAIIVSTAYLDEAERCSRVALMREGTFIRMGPPEEVKLSTGKKMIDIEAKDSRKVFNAAREVWGERECIRTGSHVRIFVDDGESALKKARALLRKKKIYGASVKEAVPGLEESFMEIVQNEEV